MATHTHTAGCPYQVVLFGALGSGAAAKALLRWSATEREAWLDAVINPAARDFCRAGYCRWIIWGNKDGDRLQGPQPR